MAGLAEWQTALGRIVVGSEIVQKGVTADTMGMKQWPGHEHDCQTRQ